QHDHIRDTCVPNFLFYNIPLMILFHINRLWLQLVLNKILCHNHLLSN
ncbi:hypothetical protein, partial [Staphylococcus aureus]